MDFEQGLHSELASITGMTGKVFPLEAPEKTLPDYIVYHLGSKDRISTLNEGPTNQVEPTHELNIVSTTYSGLKTLMPLVIAKLKSILATNIGGSGPYIQNVKIVTEFETKEPATNYYTGIIECQFFYDE